MNQEALSFYQSLDKGKDFNEILNTLNTFILYLTKLCEDNFPNGLKDKFINEWIFKTDLRNSTDLENYLKANLFASKKSLSRIKYGINEENASEVTIRMLKDFVCDLKPFVTNFDKNQDYDWLFMNTNSHITNFYFDLSKNIFFNGKPGKHQEEKFALASSASLHIRQSIEYKIKRILGIDYWLIDGRPDIQTTAKCFKAIKANLQYYRTRNIDFELIRKIHSWTNTFIHGGYRPKPWQTETALNNLVELFYSGETTVKNSYSLYAGVEVLESDLPYLLKNTEEVIKNESGKKIEIKWLDKPEIAII